MQVAIYLRVSSPKKKDIGKGKDNPYLQNPEVQVGPLQKFASFREWDVFKIYTDRMTGSKNEARPGYKELWNDARKGNFKAVIVWRFDRFARTTIELLRSLEEFRALGIDFVSSTENIDTTTPMGKATFTIIAAIAELERATTIERINLGMERAREVGTKSGKPIGGQRNIFRRDRAIDMYEAGQSIRQIAQELGQSPATIGRVCKGVSRTGSLSAPPPGRIQAA